LCPRHLQSLPVLLLRNCCLDHAHQRHDSSHEPCSL
jgi:hypothetical protein